MTVQCLHMGLEPSRTIQGHDAHRISHYKCNGKTNQSWTVFEITDYLMFRNGYKNMCLLTWPSGIFAIDCKVAELYPQARFNYLTTVGLVPQIP